MTIGNNFYDLNATRGYPLDDLATGISDAGLQLPNGVIVDICLRFPDSLGLYAFISAVHVSSKMVSIAISASNDLTTQTLNPIATLAIAQPVHESMPYNLVGLMPGVGGWIIFGELDKVNYQGSFATAKQGLLLSQPARSYQALPIPWASKILDEYELQGLVKLLGGKDVSVTTQPVEINGMTVQGIVFSLVGDLTKILPLYTGPCGGRPESHTCQSPPIESINEVTPDAAGNIQISFPDMTLVNVPHGLLVSTNLSLPSICPQQAYTGQPDQDFCVEAISDDSIPFSLSQITSFPGTDGDPGFESNPGGSSSSDILVPVYPNCVRFYSNQPLTFHSAVGIWYLQDFGDYGHVRCAGLPGELSTQRRMYYTPGTGPGYAITDYVDYAYSENVGIEIQTVVYSPDATGRIGLVLDHRKFLSADYFTAVYLDLAAQTFSIQRLVAGAWVVAAGALTGLNLQPGHYYSITVQIQNSTVSGRVDINASFFDAQAPQAVGSGGSVQILGLPGYGINTGRPGFFAMDGRAYFTHLYMNEL